jgi:VanZ family protein
MMIAIFIFSSTPSEDLPNFALFDEIVKKGGHMIGYALLAISYHFGFKDQFKYKNLLAFFFCILYALSDEYHQYFVPGRHSNWSDILIDSIGAIAGLSIYHLFRRK